MRLVLLFRSHAFHVMSPFKAAAFHHGNIGHMAGYIESALVSMLAHKPTLIVARLPGCERQCNG